MDEQTTNPMEPATVESTPTPEVAPVEAQAVDPAPAPEPAPTVETPEADPVHEEPTVEDIVVEAPSGVVMHTEPIVNQ